jgi:hypothetical protein
MLQAFRVEVPLSFALKQEATRGSLVEKTMSHGAAAGQSSGKRVSAEGAVLLTDPWGSSASRSICLIRTCHVTL